MKPKAIDIVIPLGSKCGWGDYEELRYALRSAERYVYGLGKVLVVGEKPAWLKDEYHIGQPDPYPANKDANLIQKVIRACIEPELSEEFIRMSDDQLFLAPWDPQLWYLERIEPDHFHRQPQKWYKRLENTCRALKGFKKPVYNYDAHIPMLYNKRYFIQTVTRYSYGSAPGMCINTLYGNHLSGGKLLPIEARLGIAGPTTQEELGKRSINALFCNYIDKGLSDHFKYWIHKKFDRKSRFEK